MSVYCEGNYAVGLFCRYAAILISSANTVDQRSENEIMLLSV